MPVYTYKCYDKKGGCGMKWDEQTTIDDRNNALDEECPGCAKKGTIIRMITEVSISGTSRDHGKFDVKKMDPEVRSRLEAVKNRKDINPGASKIDW